jgi:Tol biopolymer transport system component
VLFVRRYTRPDTLISFELSKAPAAGGAATVITPSTSSMDVLSFVITPDSQRAIVYVGGNGNPDLQDLWSVPLNGSPAVKLDAALNDGDPIGLYKVSPDSARVVFRVQGPINGGFLCSAPVTGGALATFAPLVQGPGIGSTYFITPDSARIVFVEQARYYSAPIDGSAQRIPISAEQEGPSYNDTLNVQFTRDSAYMLFRGRTAGDTATRLFITPLATTSVGSVLSGDVAYVGGPPDTQDGGLVSIRQSADSSRVIFRAGADQFSGRALYATTISGLGIVKDKRVYLPALNR